MKTLLKIALPMFLAMSLFAQSDGGIGMDHATVQIGAPLHIRADLPAEGYSGTPVHPVYFEHRRPRPGCDNTAACGELLEHGIVHNLRTSAGTTWQYNQMAGTTAAVGTYIALTNTAVTPAEADTTLSGEIASNGFSRALSTPTNASTTLALVGTPTPTVVGTTGAVTYFYWAAACNQGICNIPSTASGTVTTANATLSTTNYVNIAFTGQNGAATYEIYRTATNVSPTAGAGTVKVNGQPFCTAALACTILDQSNTLIASNVAASNLTNFGKYTLVNTWTATGTQSMQAFGVLNAASSGTLVFEGTFTSVTCNTLDTFQLTETVYY